jgi:hypothetical protein
MRVVVAEGHCGERKKEEMCRNREKNGFLADFGPDFPLPQAINEDYIYRRWKRVISSSPG